MIKVHLHGFLADKYSAAPIELDAPTPFMVVQGLVSMFGPEFSNEIREGQWTVVRGALDDSYSLAIGDEEVHMLLGDVTELHILPPVTGSSGVARMVVGIVLMVVGYAFPALAPYLYPLGISMILGGVVELLTPAAPKLGNPMNAESADQRPSFLFNGPVNVMEQGGPVPLVYGHIGRCGSVVVSAGLYVEQI